MDIQADQIKDQITPTNLENLQQQLEDAQNRNIEFALVIEELSIERDCLKRQIFAVEGKVREREEELLRRIDDGVREKEFLEVEIYEGVREREELVKKIDVGMREKEGLLIEVHVFKEKEEELEKNLSKGLGVVGLIKECLMSVNEVFDEKELENMSNFEENLKGCKGMEDFLWELDQISSMAKRVEEKMVDYGGKEDLLREIKALEEKIKELEENLLKNLEVLGLIEECLMRVNENLDEKKLEIWVDHKFHDIEEKVLNFEEKLKFVLEMAKRAEDKMNVHLENVKKEKRELERSVMSLTEENRDVNALLRIALVEKEAVEKSLSKLRGNYEQRRVPLLQFAERGLQRVGFGFMIGGSSNDQYEDQKKHADQTSDHMTSNSSVLSDVSSECEEEAAVSLVQFSNFYFLHTMVLYSASYSCFSVCKILIRPQLWRK